MNIFLDWVSDLSRTDQIGWIVTIVVLLAVAGYGIWQGNKTKVNGR